MAEVPKIVLPHGGYKSLIVYKKSDLVYEGTVLFCRRFLPARDWLKSHEAEVWPSRDKRQVAARTAARGESWDKAVYSRLDAAASAAELAARAAEIKQSVDQAVWSLKKRKGWR